MTGCSGHLCFRQLVIDDGLLIIFVLSYFIWDFRDLCDDGQISRSYPRGVVPSYCLPFLLLPFYFCLFTFYFCLLPFYFCLEFMLP